MVQLIEEHKNEEACLTKFNKLRIAKNAFILCFVFVLTFIAYDSLSMLQSTLNHKHGIGVISQATFYGCFCITSLVLPKYIIKKLGCKLTLVISMILYLPYIASNFYPQWFFMVPTAAINGISGSLLWGAQCQYLNEIAVQYASQSTDDGNKKKQQKSNIRNMTTISEKISPSFQRNFVLTESNEYDEQNVTHVENRDTFQNPVSSIQKENSKFIPNIVPEDSSICIKHSDKGSKKAVNKFTLRSKIESTTAVFFGIHGLAYLSVHVWSNIMSYFILQSNAVYSNITLNSSCTCGANFCAEEKSDCLAHNLHGPTSQSRYILTGVCLALILTSIIIMTLFLDPLNDRHRDVRFSLDFLLATVKQMKKMKQILLTPISFYFGLIQGYYMGDFNLSFVGCAWGTSHVALVSACYGAACAFSSPVAGWLVKLIGRIPVISFSMLVQVVAQILLLNWTPSPDNPVMFFILAALCGTTVGILFSQTKAIHGFLFKDNQEAAFGAYHVWVSLGICLSFAYSNHLCAYVKIYTLSSVLAVGFLGYISLEVLLKLKLKKSIN